MRLARIFISLSKGKKKQAAFSVMIRQIAAKVVILHNETSRLLVKYLKLLSMILNWIFFANINISVRKLTVFFPLTKLLLTKGVNYSLKLKVFQQTDQI